MRLLTVGALGAAGLALLVVLFFRVAPSGPPEPSALHHALREVRPDGTWSRATALRAFTAVFGPLPGVPAPAGTEQAPEPPGAALRMLGLHLPALGPAVRESAVEAAGPLAYTLLEADPDTVPGAARAPGVWRERVGRIADVLAERVGRAGPPIETVLEPRSFRGLDAASGGIYGPGGELERCRIHVFPPAYRRTGAELDAILAHEVWGCFQRARLGTRYRWRVAPPWIVEGQAMWVGQSVAGGTPGLGRTIRWWRKYLVDPGPARALFGRAYDAIGFYAWLEDAGVEPWAVLDPVLDGSVTNLRAFDAALAGRGAQALTGWGASWFRDGIPTRTFALDGAPGIPGPRVRPAPAPLAVGPGDSAHLATPPLGGAVAELTVRGEVLSVEVEGYATLGDPRLGREWTLDHEVRGFCLGAACSCPTSRPVSPASGGGSGPGGDEDATAPGADGEGSAPETNEDPAARSGGGGAPLDPVSGTLRVGLTGGPRAPGVALFRSTSLEDWCRRPAGEVLPPDTADASSR